jgi:hypothetical protein
MTSETRRISLDDLSSAFQAMATSNSIGNNNNSNKIMTMSSGGNDRHSSLSRNVSSGNCSKRGIHLVAGSGLVGTRGLTAAAAECCQSDNSVVDDRSSVSPRFAGNSGDRLRSRSEESLLDPSSSMLLLSEKYHTNDRRSASSKLVPIL